MPWLLVQNIALKAPMNHIPNPSEMLELSLWSFAEHARELMAKHNQMTPKQRQELAEIGRELVKLEAA